MTACAQCQSAIKNCIRMAVVAIGADLRLVEQFAGHDGNELLHQDCKRLIRDKLTGACLSTLQNGGLNASI